MPTAGLISPSYGAERRALIDPAHAQTYEDGQPAGRARSAAGQAPRRPTSNPQASTTHISIIDARGNAIALTCTIEQEFGSAVVAPGTGFLLNNELTDFGDPGTANEPGPGKRPRSSIAPTILVQGRHARASWWAAPAARASSAASPTRSSRSPTTATTSPMRSTPSASTTRPAR